MQYGINILPSLPVMTWDLLGPETLGEDWVVAPEVVASEETMEATIHYLYM